MRLRKKLKWKIKVKANFLKVLCLLMKTDPRKKKLNRRKFLRAKLWLFRFLLMIENKISRARKI